MTAPGLSTVSAYDARHTLRLYTSLTAKGKAKKSTNLTSSIHTQKTGVHDAYLHVLELAGHRRS